jgi:outer membrane protein
MRCFSLVLAMSVLGAAGLMAQSAPNPTAPPAEPNQTAAAGQTTSPDVTATPMANGNGAELGIRHVEGSAGFLQRRGTFEFDDEPFFMTPAYFKRRFTMVSPRVELAPPVHMDDYVVGGKLELSLKQYLELVMSNNPDISIQKLSVEVQKNAIQRAFSVFDPTVLARFNSTRQESPARDILAGAVTLNQLTQPFAMQYQQVLPNGTSYLVGFNNNRLSTNSANATFNPSHTSNMNLNITQPLLRSRGSYFTKLPITIARGRLKVGMNNLEDSVMQLIAQAETVYWNLIETRENLRVQELALALADTALKRSQRELELGAISSLEIYQPQANYANAEIFVTQARYRLQQAEDAVRRQIGADQIARYREMPIVLTESVAPPAAVALDKEELVQRALVRRPDLRASVETLANDDLVIRQANNALLPDLSVTAQYGSFGQGGTFYRRTGNVTPEGAPIVSVTPGGFGDAFSQMWGFGFPTYGFGLTLRLPIKDRRASADLADAVVTKRIDTLRNRSIQQNIRLQVLQAVNQVENSKASVQLAQIARDLAQKRVDAEQKRYELGTTTIFFVLAAQNDLTTAEAALVRESINYRRNLLTLLQRTGELLDERGIQVQ